VGLVPLRAQGLRHHIELAKDGGDRRMLRLVLELVLGKPCARRGYLVALLHLMAQCSQGQVASRNLGGPP